MSGYTVYADFEITPHKKTIFYTNWKEKGCRLGITVKDRDDWSFNKNNIADVESCDINNQRHFKYYKNQQDFLDKMYLSFLEIN